MNLNEILKKSKSKNTFTIIKDDETAVLLYEGKTILANPHYDFHFGREEAFFQNTVVKKSWRSPLELYQRIKTQFKLKSKLEEYDVEENLYEFLDKKDMYAT